MKSRARRSECVYAMTCDVGLKQDASYIIVFHVEARARPGAPPASTLVVDATSHLSPTLLHRRIGLDEVDQAIGELAERYRVTRVHGDSREAGGLAVLLKARGITFVEMSMSLPAQEKRAVALAHRFGVGSIRLVDDPVLVKQLKELRVTRRPGGGIAIEGRGKHDDGADALLLAAEVATTLPAAGGDIENVVTSVHFGEGGLDVQSHWRDARTRMPCGPPVGSPQWLEIRRAQRDAGIRVVGEPSIDDYDNET